MKRALKISILLALIILLAVIGLFINYSYSNFIISESFTPIPLSFDPANSTSTYDWNEAAVTIQGGFVKGKVIDNNKIVNLVLRSLSPTPVITVKVVQARIKHIIFFTHKVNAAGLIHAPQSSPESLQLANR